MKPLPLAVVAVLVAAGAAVHGSATYRWETLAPDPACADALHAHAVQLADYQSEVVPAEFEIKEKSRVTCRRYTSEGERTGLIVSVTTGPPGAVATHTPDVCYPTSGYRTLSATKRETVQLPGGGSASYYVAEFEKKSATRTDRQKVRWTWAIPGGAWDAPDSPRLAYLHRPELFKLYVVSVVPPDGPDRSAEDTPAVKRFVAAAFAQYAGLLAAR